jgi:hypothetical protein
MTAEQVKEKLLAVYEGREGFSVSFSGLPKTFWGKYLPCTRSIVIDHRKMANDMMLMYTALHELAHHVCYHDKGQEGRQSHTKLFWGVYHDLLDRAEARGIYRRSGDPEIGALVERAREKDRAAAALQRELGGILGDLWELCERKGVRPEDVIERQAGLSRKTMKAMLRAAQLTGMAEAERLGQDAQERLGKARKEGGLRELMAAYLAGRSMAQLDRGKEGRDPDPLKRLEAEAAALDHKIQLLQERLFFVSGRIVALERQEQAG